MTAADFRPGLPIATVADLDAWLAHEDALYVRILGGGAIVRWRWRWMTCAAATKDRHLWPGVWRHWTEGRRIRQALYRVAKGATP